MKWIDASDIKNWANLKPRDCQDTMPELIRRLILAHTAKAVVEFDFPSGDSVATSGWDGRLNTPVVSPFFPGGASGWEIGTEKSAKAKAEKDYAKRTADPLGLVPSDTTFVFVTPRSWPKRGEWQSDKRSEKKWKDTRVVNADGLEQWLESTPAVALWLARKVGKVVSGGIRDIGAFWEEWSIGTKPVLTSGIVIGGRTNDVESVQKWIAEPPRILEVQGDHPDEAFAFLYGAIDALPKNERTQALARCIIVENISELRQLTQAFPHYPLIIAAPGECIDAAHAAVAKGHHVFISMNAAVIGIRPVLRLARPQRSEVEKILHEGGLSEADAQRVARDSGRSIPVLRRHLFQSNAVRAPSWASAESARVLIPVLFANSWDERREGDRLVIESLTGMSHETFVKELSPFLSIDDSPVRKVGNVWMIKSPLDAWFLLAPHLTEQHLKLFEQSLFAVLTKTDPKYELEAEKRWAAAIYGKSNPYSEWIRTGLVESLVLLAVYGNRSPNIASTQAFADEVVAKVFSPTDKWEVWASIKDATPLLSEASPDTFMKAVEEGIARDPAVFENLLKDDGSLFGECRHSGLLWALEGIAWSSQYLAQAVDTLAALGNLDPGGRWANRPINSLGDIFLPGLPQTHATPDERLEVLERLVARFPKMVWRFAEKYYGGGHVSESHRFRWRDTGGDRRGLEQEQGEEHRRYVKGLFPLLRDLACMKENLIDALGKLTRLPRETRDKILTTLEASDAAAFSKEDRALLLHNTREALHWINRYDKEDLHIHVPALNQLLEQFAPEDVIERVGWLLSSPWPQLPGGEPEDYRERDVSVKTAQKEAAREVLDKASMEKILEFSGTVQYQGVLGHSLAMAVRDEVEDNSVLDGLLTRAHNMPLLTRGYALGRAEVAGSGWVKGQIDRLKAQKTCSPEACALLYLGLPEGPQTWAAVTEQGTKEEAAYWKQASGYSRSGNEDDNAIAVEKLLDVKRPEAALHIAGGSKADLPSKLLQRLLEEILKMDKEKIQTIAAEEYALGHVFDQLYRKNELSIDEMAKLEWPFVGLFERLGRYTSSPMALHRVLQKDPSFFAQLITFIYKRDDHAPDPLKNGITGEMAERRGQVTYELLNSWHLLPGLKDDGTLEENELTAWVDAARRLCADNKHTRGCDIQIGLMLAHSPTDPDGIWPHIAVRNLIERLKSEIIERHIQIEIYNSRGVVRRGLNDGGAQERDLAERYKKMGDALRTRWPRSASMLRSMADSYENEAKVHDVESDLHDLRWD